MRSHRIDNPGMLSKFLGEVVTYQGMGPFDALIDGLADIMQQTGPLRKVYVDPEFRGHETSEVGDLNAVRKEILTVTRAVFHPSDMLQKFLMSAVQAGFKQRIFTGMQKFFVKLLSYLL